MNSNDLIALLVQKLSIDEEQAEGMVSEWIQHLGAELSTSGQADIPGIGTLILEGSKLHFELDPGFAMEVNYKYLGMKPIVISDDINIGLKEPEVEDEIEEDSVLEPNDTAEMDEVPPSEKVIVDEGASDDEEVVEPQEVAETEDVSEDTDSEEIQEEEEVQADEDFEPEGEEEETEPEEIDSEHQGEEAEPDQIEELSEAELEQSEEPEQPEQSEESEEESEELDEATKARIARRTAALRSTRKEKKSNNIPLWVGLGVILVAAIVAGWQFYLQPVMQNPASLVGSSEELNTVIPGVDSLQSENQPISQPSSEDNQQLDQQVDQQEEALSQNLASEVQESPAPAAEEAVVSSNKKDSVVSAPLNATSPNNIPPGQPKYGLTGVVNSQANDGYTLVLFSLSNRQSAMEKYQLYRDQGYRSLVSPVTSERYGLMWRVSIGQFATVNEALSAAEELPTELAKDYFITKI